MCTEVMGSPTQLARFDEHEGDAETFSLEVSVHNVVFHESSNPMYGNLLNTARLLLAVDLFNMPRVVIEAPEIAYTSSTNSSALVINFRGRGKSLVFDCNLSELKDPTLTLSVLCRTDDNNTYLLASCALDMRENLDRAAYRTGGPTTSEQRFHPVSLVMAPTTVKDVPVTLNSHIRMRREGVYPEVGPVLLPEIPSIVYTPQNATTNAEVQTIEEPSSTKENDTFSPPACAENLAQPTGLEAGFCPPAFTLTSDNDIADDEHDDSLISSASCPSRQALPKMGEQTANRKFSRPANMDDETYARMQDWYDYIVSVSHDILITS